MDNYSEMSHLSAKTRVAGPATCFPLPRALVTFFSAKLLIFGFSNLGRGVIKTSAGFYIMLQKGPEKGRHGR